ncbi:MAG: hypothetical protein NDI77_09120 [Geobacteraceae bacterium]|nr:hypothetical protein [Geobacteraceae bacterium]
MYKCIICVCILGFALSGCMSIKDTSGIKQYLQDQGKSEIFAIDLKSKIKDKKSKDYKHAETLFNNAAGAGNGWAKGIIFDARVNRELNVPVQDYKNSEAGKNIEAFLGLQPGIAAKAFDPVTGALIATFVISVVDMIEKQNDKRVETAIQVIEKEFSKASWTTFELTTPQFVKDKYKQ